MQFSCAGRLSVTSRMLGVGKVRRVFETVGGGVLKLVGDILICRRRVGVLKNGTGQGVWVRV